MATLVLRSSLTRPLTVAELDANFQNINNDLLLKAPIASPTFTGTVKAPSFTSTTAIGTAPFTVTSTTVVANLNVSSLNGATFASPGAIGGTTAGTGAFTSLTASSTVSGTGFSTYLASPPAIGGTTASAGAFTSLTASSTVSGTGFSTYLASPPAIGGTTAGTGAFTSLSTTNLNYTGTLTGGTGILNIGSGQIYKNAAGDVGIGVSTSISAVLHLKAGTGVAGTAPLKLTSGTKLTTAEAGTIEYDGVAPYFTSNTTSGRGFIPTTQMFRLTSSGTGITATVTGTNYFGANSNIALAANSVYEIEIVAFFTKSSTAPAAAVWNLIFPAAPTHYTVHYEMSPLTGIVAPPGSATMLVGRLVGQALATCTVATGLLPIAATNNYARFKLFVQTSATSTSMKINIYNNTAGTITPLAGSYWKAIQIPANTGTFVA